MFNFETIEKSSEQITLNSQVTINKQSYHWDVLLLVGTKLNVTQNTSSFFLRANIRVLLAYTLISFSCGLILFWFWAYEHVLNRTDKYTVALVVLKPASVTGKDRGRGCSHSPFAVISQAYEMQSRFCITIMMYREKQDRSQPPQCGHSLQNQLQICSAGP